MIIEQSEITKNLLQAALRESEENPHLGHYLSEHARVEGDQHAAEFCLSQTADNERKAHLLHEALEDHQKPVVIADPKVWRELAARLRNRIHRKRGLRINARDLIVIGTSADGVAALSVTCSIRPAR